LDGLDGWMDGWIEAEADSTHVSLAAWLPFLPARWLTTVGNNSRSQMTLLTSVVCILCPLIHVCPTPINRCTETTVADIERTFVDFTTRDDVGIVLINQHVANMIRHLVDEYSELVPTVLEIPSKDHPYDPSKDHIMKQVNMMLGTE
jgi:vacuolar-type H+-ATPase subunit F/Vma7